MGEMAEYEVVEQPEAAEVEVSAPSEMESDQTTEQGEESTAETQAEERQKQDGVQKRINELTRKRYEAERRALELEERVREFENSTRPQPQQLREPTINDFRTYDEYVAAVADYKAQVAVSHVIAQQRAEQAHQAQQAAHEARMMVVEQKVAEAVKKYPDFMAVINDQSLPPLQRVNPAAFDALVGSDHMADVAYYLGKNPSEAYRLAQMKPLDAARFIGTIEAKVSYQKKETTNAPAPPKTVGQKATAEKDPDKMTMEEWVAWRESKIKR